MFQHVSLVYLILNVFALFSSLSLINSLWIYRFPYINYAEMHLHSIYVVNFIIGVSAPLNFTFLCFLNLELEILSSLNFKYLFSFFLYICSLILTCNFANRPQLHFAGISFFLSFLFMCICRSNFLSIQF